MINFANINYDIKFYNRKDVIFFLKTHDEKGQFSNMHKDPLKFLDTTLNTAEALYQAIRYPYHPSHQIEIISNPSPIGAKCVSRKYSKDERPDWMDVNVRVLEWCATVKLLQHWNTFGPLLDETGDKPIVEETNKYDKFWAARRTKEDPDILEGANVFGQILMNIRTFYRDHKNDEIYIMEPMDIPDFMFLGKEIPTIEYKLVG